MTQIKKEGAVSHQQHEVFGNLRSPFDGSACSAYPCQLEPGVVRPSPRYIASLCLSCLSLSLCQHHPHQKTCCTIFRITHLSVHYMPFKHLILLHQSKRKTVAIVCWQPAVFDIYWLGLARLSFAFFFKKKVSAQAIRNLQWEQYAPSYPCARVLAVSTSRLHVWVRMALQLVTFS